MPRRTMNIERSEFCFVGMAIGDIPDYDVSSDELRELYNNVIEAALLQARPSLDVRRSDDIAKPGTITDDILTQLMEAEYAVFDITYPNPNVFYELGVRHCCGLPAIIIRNEEAPETAPFDVRQQRHISYQTTPQGIQELAADLEARFDWYESNPDAPDNPVLKHASRLNFSFPKFVDEQSEKEDALAELVTMMVTDDNIRDVVLQDVPDDKRPMVEMLFDAADREKIQKLVGILSTLGVLNINEMLEADFDQSQLPEGNNE